MKRIVDPTWLISMVFDFSLPSPAAMSVIGREVGLVEGVGDHEVLLDANNANRFVVTAQRKCSYSIAVISTPRAVVEGAQRNNIPLTNEMLVGIIVQEVGK